MRKPTVSSRVITSYGTLLGNVRGEALHLVSSSSGIQEVSTPTGGRTEWGLKEDRSPVKVQERSRCTAAGRGDSHFVHGCPLVVNAVVDLLRGPGLVSDNNAVSQGEKTFHQDISRRTVTDGAWNGCNANPPAL